MATADPTPFARSLGGLLAGASSVEAFCARIIEGAIEDVLLLVARDERLEYASLVARYRDRVVKRHASLALDPGSAAAGVQCSGMNKNGRRCSKRSVLNGYCATHAEQAAEESARKRRLEAYRESVAASAAPDASSMVLGPVPTAKSYHVQVSNTAMDLL
jgi:hypothetical protein